MPESRNPHLDDNRIVWDDNYSGAYSPVAYDQQFDQQWQLFRQQTRGFTQHAGAETRDPWVDERICELTGVDGFLEQKRHGWLGYRVRKMLRREKKMGLGSELRLEPAFAIDHFQGHRTLRLTGNARQTFSVSAAGCRRSCRSASPRC